MARKIRLNMFSCHNGIVLESNEIKALYLETLFVKMAPKMKETLVPINAGAKAKDMKDKAVLKGIQSHEKRRPTSHLL